MKLLKKQTVFLSSAEKGNGTRGEFSISLPQNDAFDETTVFKLWISQLHIRNTFPTVTPQNCSFDFALAAPDADPTFLASKTLPTGIVQFYDVAALLGALLYDTDSDLRCSTRYCRLYYYNITNNNQYDLWLKFEDTATSKSAHEVFGFPAPGVYCLQADLCPPDADGSTTQYSADLGSLNPQSTSLSPNIMNVNVLSHLLVTTSLPGDNYIVNSTGVSNAGVTCDVPITVDPLSLIVYTDREGSNAIYERGRTVVSSLNVTLSDKNQNVVIPDEDWSFVLNIEQYQDTEQLLLDGVSRLNNQDSEVVQLLKMLLLQKEFRPKKPKLK